MECIDSGCDGLHIAEDCGETDDIQLRRFQGEKYGHRIICTRLKLGRALHICSKNVQRHEPNRLVNSSLVTDDSFVDVI